MEQCEGCQISRRICDPPLRVEPRRFFLKGRGTPQNMRSSTVCRRGGSPRSGPDRSCSWRGCDGNGGKRGSLGCLEIELLCPTAFSDVPRRSLGPRTRAVSDGTSRNLREKSGGRTFWFCFSGLEREDPWGFWILSETYGRNPRSQCCWCPRLLGEKRTLKEPWSELGGVVSRPQSP